MTAGSPERKQEARHKLYYALGALAFGIAAVLVIAIFVSLAAFFPVGQFLPRLPIFSVLGLVFCIFLTAAVALIVGSVRAVKRRSWWPACLAVLAVIGMAAASRPGIETYASMRWYAYELLSARGAKLVKAIEGYQAANAKPPVQLDDLVPEYLEAVPGTGMAAGPAYDYSATPGPCSNDNAWHLFISAGQFLSFDYLFYCPLKDYDKDISSFVLDRRRVIGEWIYQFEL